MQALKHKTIIRSLAAVGVAFGVFISSAHAGSIEELQSFNSNFKTASGNFTQQVKGKTTKSSSGSFIFSRPGKFRWTYAAPYEQVLVSDGKTLSIYDKDLKQVTKRSLGSAIGSSPAAVLFGSGDLSKNFTLTDAGERDGRNWVYAKPRGQSSFSSVNIGMKNGVPDAVVLFDNFGQTTILFFSGFQKNPGVSAGTFNFTAPAGTRSAK
jgi:outer membrane lipoprotein carrier protein